MHELVGKFITKIYLSEDQQCLRFKTSPTFRASEANGGELEWTDGGDLVYLLDESGCSDSWFEDIEGVAFLLDAVVLAVRCISTEDIKKTEENKDEIFGYAIKTTRGDASIIYRNSAGSFYGGHCALITSKSNICDERKITEDWSG